MKWLALIGFVLSTAAVGAARFGGWFRPAVWLDVLFILCAAATVATTVSLIIMRLHGAAHNEWARGLTDANIDRSGYEHHRSKE